MAVPKDALEEETSYAYSLTDKEHILYKGQHPPLVTCLMIKIIFNKLWVRAAGWSMPARNGSVAKAFQVAGDVLKEAQDIYHDKFIPANRLQSRITLTMVSRMLT